MSNTTIDTQIAAFRAREKQLVLRQQETTDELTQVRAMIAALLPLGTPEPVVPVAAPNAAPAPAAKPTPAATPTPAPEKSSS